MLDAAGLVPLLAALAGDRKLGLAVGSGTRAEDDDATLAAPHTLYSLGPVPVTAAEAVAGVHEVAHVFTARDNTIPVTIAEYAILDAVGAPLARHLLTTPVSLRSGESVRICPGLEPTGMPATAITFVLPDAPISYLGPGNALFSQQLLAGYSVSRGISDSLFSLSGTFDRLIDPAITHFRQVLITHPNHADADIQDILFFGTVPDIDSTYALAADKTPCTGHDYGFYLSARAMPLAMIVMPADCGSSDDPGDWLRDYFGSAGNFPDFAYYLATGSTRPLYDVSQIQSVTGWGSTVPARDIVGTASMSAYQMAQKITDELEYVLMVKWRDVGSTRSYTHQDPAYRIIRRDAVDYDTGGEGVGYHDTTTANLGGAYTRDAVDVEHFASEPGYSVGWIRDGEWLKYTVNFPVTGTWTAKFRTASAAVTGARSFKVYLDNVLVEDIAVDGTGAYSRFVWNSDECDLTIATAGNHVIKLLFDNAGDDVADLLHMNIAALDFWPPVVASPAAVEVRTAIYFANANATDAALDTALDLPPKAVFTTRGSVISDLKYQRDSGSLANTVVVRFKWTDSDDGTVHDEIHEVSARAWSPTEMEGWIDHVETLSAPISAATLAAATTAATAIATALVDYYAQNWGTLTATFVGRTDLQFYQRIGFVGRTGIPDVDPTDDADPNWFRITNIRYDVVGSADTQVHVTAMPVTKFKLMRTINRLLHPDDVSETEAVVTAMTATKPGQMAGTVASVATPNVVVTLDVGGTLTARGVAAVGDRVVCVATSGGGYVATVTDATPASAEKGDLQYFDGSSWVRLAHGTAGQVLTSGGHGAAPAWGAGLPASPSTGDILYWNGTAWVRLAAGSTSGHVLTSNGAGAAPSWQALP